VFVNRGKDNIKIFCWTFVLSAVELLCLTYCSQAPVYLKAVCKPALSVISLVIVIKVSLIEFIKMAIKCILLKLKGRVVSGGR